MTREQAGQVFTDVAIHRTRTDVPVDVIEAMRVALNVITDLALDAETLDVGGPDADAVRARRRAERAAALAGWGR